MGQVWVREFKGGLDTRRLPETTPGGALIFAQDCHITQGGEIEQRADFLHVYTAPPGECVGLAASATHLVVFGHAATHPTDLPFSLFAYTQLAHPSGLQLQRTPSWTNFGADIAVIGAFGTDPANSERYMFLGGDRITDSEAPPNLDGIQPFAVETFAKKLFSGAGTHLFFSTVLDGMDWTTTAEGAGFVDMAFEIGQNANVRALAPYEDLLAVFFQRAVMTWSVDPDPDATAAVQTLKGVGTFSSQAVVPYKGGDVIFYDPTGIRSLRARDSSKSAYTADIGSAIDTLTQAAYATTDPDRLEMASAVIEPATGRIWIAIEDTIFVLSQYDVTKVTAWSVYKPGFVIDYMTVFQERVWLRSGEDFYVYGSVSTASGPYQYSEDVQAEAWLPYLDADQPAQIKHLRGVDVSCRGSWEVRIGYDPENLDATDLLARVGGTTFGHARIPVDQGEGTHMSLRFRSLAPLSESVPAVLSSAVIHHDLDDQEDS
jgi:hypothetical protein